MTLDRRPRGSGPAGLASTARWVGKWRCALEGAKKHALVGLAGGMGALPLLHCPQRLLKTGELPSREPGK
jgi:hypothetical protein